MKKPHNTTEQPSIFEPTKDGCCVRRQKRGEPTAKDEEKEIPGMEKMTIFSSFFVRSIEGWKEFVKKALGSSKGVVVYADMKKGSHHRSLDSLHLFSGDGCCRVTA